MTALPAAAATALWFGILTSISPCPLASNVAAVSFVGRNIGHPRGVLLAGLAYSVGRAVTYVLVGMLVVSSILSIPGISFFLQRQMNQILGPLLILMGIVLLGGIRIPLPTWSGSEATRHRLAGGGTIGAGLLGMLFALSFCPVSAGLFFGALVPLAVSAHSRILLPAIYGVGTGLPVVVFALFLALGARGVGRAFHLLTRFERAARRVTGVIFILAGGYLSLTHIVGLDI